ncbi:MAG: sigma-70 family RNA polymerase sigma factor [Acidobacteriota bacterium]
MSSFYDRILHVADGRPDDASWFYDAYAAPLLRRLALRYSFFEPEQVEDLVHDTFVLFLRDDARVLRQFVEREGQSLTAEALERYLWDRACGLAVNRRRSAHSSRVVQMAEWSDPAGEGGVEREAQGRDALDKLDACLRGAPAKVYLYYKLRYWDGLSPAEISDSLGWSRKTSYRARQDLNRAVERCRELLGLGERRR